MLDMFIFEGFRLNGNFFVPRIATMESISYLIKHITNEIHTDTSQS